jgi:hypothetical protein
LEFTRGHPTLFSETRNPFTTSDRTDRRDRLQMDVPLKPASVGSTLFPLLSAELQVVDRYSKGPKVT